MTVIATDKAWSFSQLNNFETCPKKFYHLTIKKDYKEQDNDAIREGKRIHKALENFVGKGITLPKELAYLQPQVQKYADVQAKKYTEQQLAITAEFKPTGWFDKDVWCRAILDLAIVGDTHALLIDYKTGKMKDDGFTQLMLAAAIFMAHYPELETFELAYHWTQHDGQTTRSSVGRAQLLDLWNELLPRVGKFQEAYRTTSYPAKPSGLCRRWCIVDDCVHHGG